MSRLVASPLLLLLLLGCLTGGCGGPGFPTATLDGKVTVDGEPIPEGTISFTPISGNRGGGAPTTIAGGKYHVEGVPQGKVRVFFNATIATGNTVLQFDKPVPEYANLIPAGYQSGIEIDIQGNKMEYDFHLTAKGPAGNGPPGAGK